MPAILIGGGARSGKSRHALTLAASYGAPLGFVATGQAFDDEMRDRIAHHRQERDSAIVTIEEPFELADAIATHGPHYQALIVDCLTLWLTNIMLAGETRFAARFEEVAEVAAHSPAVVLLVTNEVGCGIVPENELARRFRDEAGRLNQCVASRAQQVHWVVFGYPMKVK